MTFLRSVFFTVFSISAATVQLKGMEKQPHMKSIHDIPAYYVNLARKVADSPDKINYDLDILGHFFKEKKIEMVSWVDTKMSTLLSDMALNVCKDAWILHGYEEPNFKCFLTLRSYDHLKSYDDREVIGAVKNEIDLVDCYDQGQTGELYDLANLISKMKASGNHFQNEIDEAFIGLSQFRRGLCSSENLEKVYKKIVHAIRQNWKMGSGKDVSPKESKDGWTVFIKRKGLLPQEYFLLCCFISYFDAELCMDCQMSPERGLLFLVKNDALDAFKQIFDFEIT